MNKKQKRQLLKLAKFLDSLKGERAKAFNMYKWRSKHSDAPKVDGPLAPCGTVCCVGGWAACLMPETGLMFRGCDDPVYGPQLGYRRKTDLTGYSSFALAFGLEHYDAVRITDPWYYPDSDLHTPTAQEAAERIREVVNDYERNQKGA